jgi:endonuclease III
MKPGSKAARAGKKKRPSVTSALKKATRGAGVVVAKAARGAARALAGKVAPGARPAKVRKRRGDAPAVLERLRAAIPRPHVELAFSDPWQLLVAVILSAQSTDRRVNQVTPEVFRRWPKPAALASADPAEVEEVIKSTGFFRNKTKAIIGASAMLTERFAGQVPRTMPEILDVPGVARKTANVVLGSAYGIASGIVIDTHAGRVAQRLGLTVETTPEKIELDLCKQFPDSQWIGMSHRLVLHGRYVCTARAPACSACPLNEVCPARLEPALGEWQPRAEREASEMDARATGFTRV